MKNIAILVNPFAGNGAALSVSEYIEDELHSQKIKYQVFATKWPSSTEDFTDIFLVGGDGTLNFLINQYPFLKIPVTVFKGGSGNDFFWLLYGNTSKAQSLEIGLNGIEKKTDSGVCNGRLFINGVGIGFDGSVVKQMQKRKMFSAGFFSYLYAVIREVFLFGSFKADITFDDHQKTGMFFMITIANGCRYGGGFIVSPGSVTNDGLLNLVCIEKAGIMKRLRYLPVMRKGGHLKLDFVRTHLIHCCNIVSDKIIPVHTDGEYFEGINFSIGLHPHQFIFRVAR